MTINKGDEIARLRNVIGVTQSLMAKMFGVTLSTWQKKEQETSTETIKVKPGEFEFLQLLAGNHPQYTLIAKKTVKDITQSTVKMKLSALETRRLRVKLGMSVDEIAERFECSPAAWYARENPNIRGGLNVGECNLLLLLADEHPYYSLQSLGAGD